MKILLISPHIEIGLLGALPEKYKKMSLGNYPPLGIMYLASYLEKYSDHKPELLDMGLDQLSLPEILEKIENGGIQAVGLYASSFNINVVSRIVKAVKKLDNNIVTILGGPHVELYPEETAMLDSVDYVVPGEGQITLKDLLDALTNKSDISAIKGVVYLKSGKVCTNDKRPPVDNLDILPFPARHLTQYKKYYSIIGRSEVTTSLMTSTGCPYRCNFCSTSHAAAAVRVRSAENVVAEIEECVNMGIREFFFFDEIFTLNKARTLAICNLILKKNLKIFFDIRSRINTVDEEMLQKLKEAGCLRIQYGIESANPETLKAMNKGITVEESIRVAKLTKKAGIEVFADFMLGYPGETKKQILNTINFAIKIDADFVQFGNTQLLPGTKIYYDALEKGFIKEDYWRNVAKDPPEVIVPPFASETFNRDQMLRFHRYAFLKFYFRPRFIYKRLIKIKSAAELFRQLKTGYHLLLG